MSGIIKCKANDIITAKHSITEMQLETAIQKHELKGKMGKETEKKQEQK